MASITERGGRYRALVRKGGQSRCATFASRAAAKKWAATVEDQLDELRAAGVMAPGAQTIGDLIDRFKLELYPVKPWGRSKSADLAALKAALGDIPAAKLTGRDVTEHFQKRAKSGAGPVTISAQAGYLVSVLRVARTLWHLDVPLQAALDARTALASVRLIGKSARRDRRVTDGELASLCAYFQKRGGSLPMTDLLHFCMATAMRISEVCRLEWRDLNETARTILVRDRKHPRDRLGNDQMVPLLDATGFDALAIIRRQPKRGPRIFPYSASTVSTYVTAAVAATGLPDLHLHDIRHEAISRLFEAGYRIEQVALVSGHRDWSMLKRYTHVRATDLHRPPAASATP
jgi:integrase